MRTTGAPSTAPDLAADELGGAVVAPVRTWRSAGERVPDDTQSTFAVP